MEVEVTSRVKSGHIAHWSPISRVAGKRRIFFEIFEIQGPKNLGRGQSPPQELDVGLTLLSLPIQKTQLTGHILLQKPSVMRAAN